MLVHVGPTVIGIPFGLQLAFGGDWRLLYWLILVPIGVTGVANATNMSAGYNGLETRQIAIASLGLIVVAQLRGAPDVSLLVFGAIFGCAAGMYYFNRYPAKVFMGDIGTLGLGAALAAGVILAHIEFYGMIAIAPAFFELAATAYYGARRENGKRKEACRNPIIDEDGTLHTPKSARHYTLAYWVLSRHASTEKSLVRRLLSIYGLTAAIAVLLALV